jgi:hypothetical protein
MMSIYFYMKTYTTEFAPSFCIFWGLVTMIGYLCGGLLMLALVGMMILALLTHEYAHVKEAQDLGVPVTKVVFIWLGGMTHCDSHGDDTVKICHAGLLDTGVWSVSSVAVLAAIYLIGYEAGWNFADPTPLGMLWWMRLIRSVVIFAFLLLATNVLPIEYDHPQHGTITTDGWIGMVIARTAEKIGNKREWGKELAP